MESFSLVTRSPTDMNFFSRRKNDAVLDNLSERSDQTCSAKSDDPEDDVRDETPSHCRDATPRAADDRHVSSFTGTNASAGSNTAYAREGIGDPNEPPSPVPAAKPVNSVDAAVNISDHVSSGENNIPLTSGAPSSAKDGSEGGVRSAEKSETSMDIDQEAHRRDLPGCVGGSSSSSSSIEVSVKAGVPREEVSARNDHNDNRVEDAVKNAGRHRGANSSTTEPGGESGFRGDVIDDNDDNDDDLDNTLVVNMEAADTGLVEDAHLHHDRHRNQTSDKTSVTLSVPKPTPSTPSLCPVFSTPRNQQHQQQTSLDIPPSVSTVLSAMSQKQYYQAVQTPSLPPSASSSLSSSCPSDVPPPLSPSCSAGPCIPAAASHSRSPSSATLTPSAKLESQHVLAPCPLEETTASVTQEHGTSRSAPAVVKTKQELGLLPTSGSKSLPIHCVVEQSPPTCASQQQERAHGVAAPLCSAPIVVLDSYAILPGATPFCDVVSASLSKLGFSSIEAREATGGIQLKNWKTLPLEAVTDRREATIEEMLGELTSVATLRVHLTSGNRSNPGSEEVKEKLMQLLLTQSKDLLLQAGCPIDKSQLDSLSTGEVTQNLSDTVCSAFHHWYARQMESLVRGEDKTDGIPHSKKQNAKANESSCHASSLLITPSPTLLSSLKREPLSRAKEDNFSSTPEPRANNQDQNGNVSSPASSYGKHALTVNNLPMPAECEEKMPDKGLGKEGIVHSKTRQDNHPNSSHGKIPSSLRDAVSGHSLQSTLHYHSHALIPQVTASSVNGSGSIPGHIPSINSSGGGGGGGGGGGNGTPYLGLMPGKTRIRTSFDPEHEIPRLHKWFSHNQHPTREQMLRYMHELNGLESRRGRRPLDLTNIIYWFKNARAAQRRACKALDDSLDDPGGAGEDGRSVEDSNGHPQHRESMADNGDPNEDSGGGGGGSLDCNGSVAIADANLPPYLPNKNAVYMIPFHPYLQASPSGHARMPTPLPGLGADASGEDQPYDLSLTKRRSSRELSPLPHKRQAREPLPGQEDAEGTPMEHSQDLTNGKNKVHFLSKSPNISDSEVECHTKRRSDSSHSNTPFFLPSSTSPICPPRFPALLDAASKMRQEIPAQSEEEHSTTTLTFPGSQRRLPDKNQDPTEGSLGYPSNGIPAYNGSGSTSPMCGERGKTVVDKSHHGHMEKGEYKDRAAANSVTSPRLNSLPNGTLPSHIFGVSIKEEDEKDELSAKHQKPGSSPRSRQSSNGAQSATSHSPDSGLELGQIHKESNRSGTHVKHSFSDEDDVENDDNVYRRERKNSYAGGRDRGAARSHGDNDSGEELEYHNHRGSSYHNHQQHPMDSMDLDSEAELLKLRLKQSKDYADYASAAAMHSNVSRLTAANMAALSLAQMGGLHLPQLPPSLAMAYYPMDPRFYPAVGPPPHSSSSPTPLTRSSVVTPSSSPSTISPHLHTHLHSHRADSRSPLPSPSAVSVAQGIPQLNHLQPHPHQHQSLSPSGQHSRGQMNSSEPRKRRTRVFIDPLTEIPKLEKWFLEDTHPSAFMIDKFCEELNTCEYRHKFPKLEPKNVQLWFKNHRAKVKRMKTVSTSDGSGGGDIGRDDLDDDMDDKVSVLNCLSTSDAGRGGGDQGRDHMEEEDVDDEMKYIFQN